MRRASHLPFSGNSAGPPREHFHRDHFCPVAFTLSSSIGIVKKKKKNLVRRQTLTFRVSAHISLLELMVFLKFAFVFVFYLCEGEEIVLKKNSVEVPIFQHLTNQK